MGLITVIIPLAPNETLGNELKNSLDTMEEIEVLWLQSKKYSKPLNHSNSRAKLMNQGAKKAKGEYLWFLHADSVLGENCLKKLNESIKKHPFCLIYFDLIFAKQTHSNINLIKLNQWGANFRSKYFNLPFGDQGFCLHKNIFKQLGGYPENAKYGEDHLLVWSAIKQKIKIVSTTYPITTSARKYQKNGWLKTTLLHQYLFFKQAFFELINLIGYRVKKNK